MPDSDISIQMIAKNAGIGKGSIYYYFESKEEIVNAVIERCYKKALCEYFGEIDNCSSALEKIKHLFKCMIKDEFHDNQKNFIVSLHLHENLMLHNKMKLVAIETVSPILADLLKQGNAEGSISTETPEESAEMIVGVITFLLDSSVFPIHSPKMPTMLKLFANVLETCLKTPKGSFDFLYKPDLLSD
jgi:AcrR family transcriptional regulator